MDGIEVVQCPNCTEVFDLDYAEPGWNLSVDRGLEQGVHCPTCGAFVSDREIKEQNSE
jgi:uncharacterized C2H2 Zn-finger protein